MMMLKRPISECKWRSKFR